jgi:hypothetical protein
MPSGISMNVLPSAHRRLEALVRDRNSAQEASEAVWQGSISAVFVVLDCAQCKKIIRLIGKLNAGRGELDG